MLPKISNGQAQIIIGAAGLGVALLALYYTKKAAQSVAHGVSNAAQAINPTNDQNIINRGVNSIFGFDNKTESIGTKIYDLVNKPSQTKPKDKPKSGGISAPEAGKLVAPFMKSSDFRFYELKPK